MEGESCSAFWDIVNMGELRSIRTDIMRRQKFVVFHSYPDDCLFPSVCLLRTEEQEDMTPSRSCLACFSAGQLPIFCGVVSTTAGAAGCVYLGLGGCRFPDEEEEEARTGYLHGLSGSEFNLIKAARRRPRAMTTASVASFPTSCGKGPVCRASITQNGGAYKCKVAPVNEAVESRAAGMESARRKGDLGGERTRKPTEPPLFFPPSHPLYCRRGLGILSCLIIYARSQSPSEVARRKKRLWMGKMPCLTPRAESLLRWERALPLVRADSRPGSPIRPPRPP